MPNVDSLANFGREMKLTSLLIALLMLVAGCGRSAQPPLPPVSSATDNRATESSPKDQADDDAKEPSGDAEDDPPATIEQKDEERVDAAEGQDVSDTQLADQRQSPVDAKPPNQLSEPSHPPDQNPPERLLLLSSEGPLIVDLSLWIDEQPYREMMDRVIDDVIRLADQNDNGATTWEELTTSPHFIYGQFGNVLISTERQRQDAIRTYDINQNRHVDRNEVPGFVAQNAGSSRIFSLESIDASFDGVASAVFRWLDVNGDERLHVDERESSAVRLGLLDANDDDTLVSSELTEDQSESMPRRRRTGYAKTTATLLSDYTDWSSLLYLLEERYALGSPLSPDDFRLPGELFRQLDADEDGQIGVDEMRRIDDVKPHVALSIRFGTETDKATPNVVITEVHEALKSEMQQTTLDDFVTFKLDRVEISVARRDGQPSGQQAALSSAWERGDADNNGYLDESEFAEVQSLFDVPLVAVDSDQDGQVHRSEATEFLVRRESAAGSRLLTRAGIQEDPLFSFLDDDNNRRLTSRELAELPKMIAQLDANQDGFVDLHEVPRAMTVEVSRGLGAAPATSASGTYESTDDRPAWFLNMDTNRDGELSAQEFLGPVEIFDQFDANQDGFLKPNEIGEHSDGNQ